MCVKVPRARMKSCVSQIATWTLVSPIYHTFRGLLLTSSRGGGGIGEARAGGRGF